MCHADKPHSVKVNSFYGFDPYFDTCERFADSPTYFKSPALCSVDQFIYCLETFPEEYVEGKLIITRFDAESLYDQWEILQIDMSIRISNQIQFVIGDQRTRTLHLLLRRNQFQPMTKHSELRLTEWAEDMETSMPLPFEFATDDLVAVHSG
jgi:hypothetical protein